MKSELLADILNAANDLANQSFLFAFERERGRQRRQIRPVGRRCQTRVRLNSKFNFIRQYAEGLATQAQIQRLPGEQAGCGLFRRQIKECLPDRREARGLVLAKRGRERVEPIVDGLGCRIEKAIPLDIELL